VFGSGESVVAVSVEMFGGFFSPQAVPLRRIWKSARMCAGAMKQDTYSVS